MNRKKILLAALFTLLTCSCNGKDNSNKDNVLIIYNVEDYISSGDPDYEDLIAKFEEEYDCEVKYYTYDTNETMYNQFKLQKEGTYDLVLASEYTCQKMIKEGLMDPIEDLESNIPNYKNNCASVLRQKLQQMKVNVDGVDSNLDQYTVGYMWGTLGLIFNLDTVDYDPEEGISWNILYDSKYEHLASIKNSMRDAYDVGLLHGYAAQTVAKQNELEGLYGKDSDEYRNKLNAYIQDLFDFKLDGSEASNAENDYKIALVKKELCTLKDNLFGFETDSGKNDIVEGSKIKINLAYSGDAVYSISQGAELKEPTNLAYAVPNEGGNIWYDAWMLPKGSKHRDLAYEFLNFISDSNNAAINMDYIGYTPFIVGEEMFTITSSYYGASEFDINQTYYSGDHVVYNNMLYCVNDGEDEDIEVNNELPTSSNFTCLEYDSNNEYEDYDMVSYEGNIYYVVNDELELVEPYDLSHIYGTLENRQSIIYPYADTLNSLQTQYPDKDVIARCGVMNDYGEYNEKVIIMWGQVKAYINMQPFYIILLVVLGAVLAFGAWYIITKKRSSRYKRMKFESRGSK